MSRDDKTIVVKCGVLRNRLHGIPPETPVRLFVDDNGQLHIEYVHEQKQRKQPVTS